MGLTVSIGVSFNKVLAKLGSDMKKPDTTTAKLARYDIRTIGALANSDVQFLYWLLGKNGIMLHEFANGRDTSTVRPYYNIPPIKTIGNSTTAPVTLLPTTISK